MVPNSCTLFCILIRCPGYYLSELFTWGWVNSLTICMCCIPILRRIWFPLMSLHVLLLMDRSFHIWVLVLFEIMLLRRRGLIVELLSFLWLYCWQYQVWLLCNCPGICLYFLEDWLVCWLLRVYSGLTGCRCAGLTVGVSMLGLGLGFIVVPKYCPRVEHLRGLILVWKLCSI